MKNLLALCLALAVAFSAEAGSLKMRQTVTLTNGWNAVYVRVAPEETTDKLFAGWPVDWVALYDPADYLTTKQFTKTTGTEGTILPGYRVWRRGARTVSSFAYVPANAVLVAFAKKAYTSDLCGTPAATRIQWHASAAQGTLNLVGVSAYPGVKTTAEAYFSGLGLSAGAFYRLTRNGTANAPKFLPLSIGKAKLLSELTDGEVLIVNSDRVEDWNGVLSVSPPDGIDFGTELKMSQLEIRNDSAADRQVAVTLCRGVAHGQTAAPDTPPLYWRDADAIVTNTAWAETIVGIPVTNRVETGGVWRVQFAVDRTACKGPTGTVYGVIAEIRDVTKGSAASQFVTYVPISLTVGELDTEEAKLVKHGGVWPTGIWVAVADLDTVTRIGEAVSYGGQKTHEIPSGGKMRVRLPIWADVDDQGKGEMWLLQRFSYGYTTNGALRVFSGAVTETDEPIGDVKRLSTPFLPTDQPEIAFESASVFGTSATATFVVGEHSKVNPMRHAQHPNHDGLLADYSGNAPSGDNFNNYVSTVKPETFSITNRISFAWDGEGKKVWEPTETLSGRLVWEFEGLRHGEAASSQTGLIRAQGRFTMQYLSPGPVRMK